MPGPICVTFQGKQGRLRIGLLDPPPRYNATPCVRPIVGTVLKFCDLPAGIQPLITQTSELALHRWGHTRDHGVLGQPRFQQVQNRPIAEACIGPHPELPNVGRTGEKTAGQEFLAARPGSGIATPQFDIPEKGRVGFQTKQRIIGSLASIARIVANLSPFLVAKYCEYSAVYIEDETRAVL